MKGNDNDRMSSKIDSVVELEEAIGLATELKQQLGHLHLSASHQNAVLKDLLSRQHVGVADCRTRGRSCSSLMLSTL